MMVVALTLLFASCDKMFINGDLDGMWRLTGATYSDSTATVGNVYYSFQRHLVKIGYDSDEKIPHQMMEYHIGAFTHNGDTLVVKGFRHYLHEEIASSKEELRKFYLFEDSTRFVVERLGDEKMVLKSDSARLFFTKW